MFPLSSFALFLDLGGVHSQDWDRDWGVWLRVVTKGTTTYMDWESWESNCRPWMDAVLCGVSSH